MVKIVLTGGAALITHGGMAPADLLPYVIEKGSLTVDGCSLTVVRAASSEKTLGIIQVVAAIGIPFVLTYTATIYWVFRGKVKISPASY